jgi:hypothetical protein
VERHKLAMLLEKGLNNPAGFVLPIRKIMLLIIGKVVLGI